MDVINFNIKGVFPHIKDMGNLNLTIYEMLDRVNFLNEKSNLEIYNKISDLSFGLRVVMGDYLVECIELTSNDMMLLNDFMGDLINNAIIDFKDALINDVVIGFAFNENLKDFDYAISRLFNDLHNKSDSVVIDSIDEYINNSIDMFGIYDSDVWDFLAENFRPWDLINGKITHEDVYDAWYDGFINEIDNMADIITEAVDINELIDFIEWYY